MDLGLVNGAQSSGWADLESEATCLLDASAQTCFATSTFTELSMLMRRRDTAVVDRS